MKSYNIGIIGGDGIGPEVMREGLKVLEAVASTEEFAYDLIEYPYNSEHYLKTKELVPDSVIDEWRTLDAFLLGAIGHPDVEPGLVERAVILGLRFGLDLYINLRPIKLYSEHLCPLKGKGPEDIDFVVVRENTEGMYSQIGGHLKKNTPDEVALVNGVYTWKGCERASRYAFELAEARAAARGGEPKGQVTLVDKANAVRPHDIWTRAFAAVAKDFPAHRHGPRLRGCVLHVDDQEPGVVRRHRHHQPLRRHHHGPRLHAPGRDGNRRIREYPPRQDLHVRAHSRLGTQACGEERGVPAGNGRCRPDDAGLPGRALRCRQDRHRRGEPSAERPRPFRRREERDRDFPDGRHGGGETTA